jgi:hypothetical protein
VRGALPQPSGAPDDGGAQLPAARAALLQPVKRRPRLFRGPCGNCVPGLLLLAFLDGVLKGLDVLLHLHRRRAAGRHAAGVMSAQCAGGESEG